MKAVYINGEDSGINGSGLPRLVDVIELVKTTIDPEHMITSLLIDGKEIKEEDWQATTSHFDTSVVEVETGTPLEFARSRLRAAPGVVESCFVDFRNARKSFQNADTELGNRILVEAVTTLQAFFEWYSTILELLPEGERGDYTIESHVQSITEICKKICQQQLYQSWWALAETLQSELEPAIDVLEDRCRELQRTM